MNDDNNICWLENVSILFKDSEIIPNNLMCISKKINCVTKLLILMSVLLIFFEVFEYNTIVIYFLLSLMIIIIFYYKEKEKMSLRKKQSIEPFQITYTNSSLPTVCEKQSSRITYNCRSKTPGYDDERKNVRDKIIENVESNKNNLKIDFNTEQFNPNFKRKTDNQNLVGGPNPKTLIAPIIAPPLASLENWKNDNEYNIATLNVVKPRYEDESGYTISDSKCFSTSRVPPSYSCGYQQEHLPKKPIQNQFKTQQQNIQDTKQEKQQEIVKENFVFPYEIKDGENEMDGSELFYKDFKTNPSMKNKYVENIYTYNNDPQNLSINKRNEPINSLIGISEPGYFEEKEYSIIEPPENVNMSNTYDPRFYGYGTSYRGYVDKVVGQPRFYYDDVDAIKMPNYLTRNSIDVTPFGDSYGPDNHGGNKYHSNITKFADKHYLDSAMQFRTEMQSRLMRKINSEQWQQKMYPIQRRGHRMMK